ncbi:hypothetical protein Tco_1431859 [Tanacetum coccineum]
MFSQVLSGLKAKGFEFYRGIDNISRGSHSSHSDSDEKKLKTENGYLPQYGGDEDRILERFASAAVKTKTEEKVEETGQLDDVCLIVNPLDPDMFIDPIKRAPG